jgi:hypothetical protein
MLGVTVELPIDYRCFLVLLQFPVVIKKNPGLGFSITGGLWSASPLEKRDNVSHLSSTLISTGVHRSWATKFLIVARNIVSINITVFSISVQKPVSFDMHPAESTRKQ